MFPSVSGYVSVYDLDILFKRENRPLILHQTVESTQKPEFKQFAPFIWMTIELPSDEAGTIGISVEPNPETGIVERAVLTRKSVVLAPSKLV